MGIGIHDSILIERKGKKKTKKADSLLSKKIKKRNFMKKEFEKKFYELFDGYRLLAIQLNGFSHSAIVDKGDSSSRIERWEYTSYMNDWEKVALNQNMNHDRKLKALFDGFSHYEYKQSPKEIIYIYPSKR